MPSSDRVSLAGWRAFEYPSQIDNGHGKIFVGKTRNGELGDPRRRFRQRARHVIGNTNRFRHHRELEGTVTQWLTWNRLINRDRRYGTAGQIIHAPGTGLNTEIDNWQNLVAPYEYLMTARA